MFSTGHEKTVTLVNRNILYDQVYRSRRPGEQVYKGTDMFFAGHEKAVTESTTRATREHYRTTQEYA